MADRDQLELRLARRPRQGEFACGATLGELATEAIRDSGKSREFAAAELSELLGWPVTISMLNAWTASAKTAHRLPAEVVGALAYVTGDFAIVEHLAKQAGVHVITRAQQARLDALDVEAEMRELRRRRRELEAIAAEGDR